MANAGARAVEDRRKKLVEWKVWSERSGLLTGFGCLLLVGALLIGLWIVGITFVALVVGGHPPVISVSLASLLGGAVLVIGVPSFVLGLILAGVTAARYDAHRGATLASRELNDAVVDSLRAHLQGENGGRYKAILTILGDLRDERATADITPALRDGDAGTRLEAAKALEKLGWEPSDDAQKANYLVATQRWDESAWLGKPAVDPLIEALKSDDKKVRQEAAKALGTIGDEEAAEPLADALKDKDEDVREAAQAALRRIEGTRPLQEVEKPAAPRAKDGSPVTGTKRKVLLSGAHGLYDFGFNKFVEYLSAHRQVEIVREDPLTPEHLEESDTLMLIGPDKPWAENEVAIVREYVHAGGNLAVFTAADLKPQHIDELLQSYGLSVVAERLTDEHLSAEDLESDLLDVDQLGAFSAGTVWGQGYTVISATGDAEILLALKHPKGGALAVHKTFGRGSVLVMSCLTLMGNKQLESPSNLRFLNWLSRYF